MTISAPTIKATRLPKRRAALDLIGRIFKRGDFLVQMLEGCFQLLPVAGVRSACKIVQDPGPRHLDAFAFRFAAELVSRLGDGSGIGASSFRGFDLTLYGFALPTSSHDSSVALLGVR